MTHAFHCGEGPRAEEVDAALASREDVAELRLGNVTHGDMERVADLLAHIVANDGVVGLVHGPAETGPRALGHRSILANACNADTLETINATVKHRERIRPLAPMATRAAAEELFELSPGASALDHVAYNFMVLTARVRPLARELVPAVVHEDGTARLQIVRPEDDPLAHAFLKAVGVRAGVEVAVNTSLNVGAPICQTAEQALTTLSRARHMDGIVIVDQDGDARLVWMSRTRPKAARERVAAWLADQDVDLQAAQLAHQASGSR